MQEARDILGLTYRYMGGEVDYDPMAAVLTGSERADGRERSLSGAEIKAAFEHHLTNCDPYRDLVLADVAGEVVGYARGWWNQESPELILYHHNGFLLPQWRRRGIGAAMLALVEDRLRDVASDHPEGGEKCFQANASSTQEGLAALLEKTGYRPVVYFYEMVRPDLEDLPHRPLPDGLEVRPVEPAHYPAIWDCVTETSREEWGFHEPTENDYQEWLSNPHFQPDLWQVAWEAGTDRVVGTVLTYIDHDENTQFDRLRGYTEGIGVVADWRRRGLATALIGMSLRAQKAAGMAESALIADVDGPGLTSLYENCGFQVVNRDTVYRKALGPR